MGIGIHFEPDDENDNRPLFGRHWIDETENNDYDKPLFGRNWLEDEPTNDYEFNLFRRWLDDLDKLHKNNG